MLIIDIGFEKYAVNIKKDQIAKSEIIMKE